MKPIQLLFELVGRGVQMAVIDGALRWRAPLGAINEEMLGRIADYRDQLTAILADAQERKPGMCSKCRRVDPPVLIEMVDGRSLCGDCWGGR